MITRPINYIYILRCRGYGRVIVCTTVAVRDLVRAGVTDSWTEFLWGLTNTTRTVLIEELR